MDHYGKLIISAVVIVVRGPNYAVMQGLKAVSTIYCAKNAAEAIVQEHKKQASIAGDCHYDYRWQVEAEDANNW